MLFCFQGGKDKEIVKWLNGWLGKIDEKVKEAGSGKSEGGRRRTVAVAVFSRSGQIVTGHWSLVTGEEAVAVAVACGLGLVAIGLGCCSFCFYL